MIKDELFERICNEITNAINIQCFNYDVILEPELVASVIYQESVGGISSLQGAVVAMRYERAFHRNYVLPLGLSDTSEEILRSTSFGLMQIMGQTAIDAALINAHEFGDLLKIYPNIWIGCAILRRKMRDEKDPELRIFNALRRYNGSLSNPRTETYANSVLNHKRNESYKLFYRGQE